MPEWLLALIVGAIVLYIVGGMIALVWGFTTVRKTMDRWREEDPFFDEIFPGRRKE